MKKALLIALLLTQFVPVTQALNSGTDAANQAITDAADAADAAVSTASEAVETVTLNQKIADIQQKYTELITANNQRRAVLEAEAQDCAGDTYCSESARLRVQANQLYTNYLEAQRQYEIARMNFDNECRSSSTNCNEETVNNLKQGRDALGTQVRQVLSQLEARDRTRNQAATFDATGVFSLEGQENRESRSFLQISNTIADWMITLVSSLAVTALIIGGFLMIISGGDESRLETGKTIFTYSLIGLLVTLTAYGIISFIQSLFYLGNT